MIEFALAALIFGITGGLKPGPLSVYVIHTTLTRGTRAGLFASLAPFVSDGPIILLSLAILEQGKQFELFIAGLSLAGAGYLLYIAGRIFISDPRLETHETGSPASFLTAVKLNLINPAPYLFWGTVGGAYLVRADLHQALVFIVLMLGSLAMTKIFIAVLLKALGKRFNQTLYAGFLKGLALLLVVFASRLCLDALKLLQVL